MDSALTVNKLLALLDTITPFALAESWDNVGLMVGAPDQHVTGVLVGLDPIESLLEEALALGANTIVTHHPLFFRPLNSVRTDRPVGRFLANALTHQLNVIACHTNLDVVAGGVSDILAQRLGLTDCTILSASTAAADGKPRGFGRIGTLSPPLSAEQFPAALVKALRCQSLLLAGQLPQTVTTVAVCGGSGSDLAEAAHERGAQVYVTAEVKHSDARWAETIGMCIIDAGHFSTENLVTDEFASRIAASLGAGGHVLPVHATREQQAPFTVYRTALGGILIPEID